MYTQPDTILDIEESTFTIANDIPEGMTPETFKILNDEIDSKIEVASPEEAVRIAVPFIRWELERKFGEHGESPKPFHKVLHSEMAATTGMIVTQSIIDAGLENLLIDNPNEQDINTARAYQELLFWMHDIRQEGRLEEQTYLNKSLKKLVRIRGTDITQNEGGSGNDLANLLEKFVYSDGRPVFGGYTREKCIRDVNATFVDFKIVPELKPPEGLGMLLQTKFDEATIFGQILALVDLSANLGMDSQGVKVFRKIAETGSWEFAELYPEIISKLKSDQTQADERFACVSRAYTWINPDQVSFASSQIWAQKMHIDKMAEQHNSQKLGEILKGLFNKSTEAFNEVVARAENLSNELLNGTTKLGAWITQVQKSGEIDTALLQTAAGVVVKYLDYNHE